MNPNELRKLKAEKYKAAKAIKDLAAKDDDRDLTEEEAAQITTLLDEGDALEADAVAIEQKEQLDARLARSNASLTAPAPEPGTAAPGAALPGSAPVQPASFDDDARFTNMRDTADRNPDQLAAFGFESESDYFLSIRESCRPGVLRDERLSRIESAFGANTESGEEGGFLILPQVSTKFLERAFAILPILDQTDKLVMTGNSIDINGAVDHDKNDVTTRYGGIIAYWVAEAGEITRSQLKFKQRTLKLNKLAALAYATEEELSDVANFGSRLTNKMAFAIGDTLVEAIMFGNGVGKPLGAFHSSGPRISTAKETNQAPDTFVFENLVNMVANLWTGGGGNPMWYYNKELIPQLSTMFVAAGTGGVPVYLPANSVAGPPHSTLWGRAAHETDHCEALGDLGDILIADYSQYLMGMKGTVQSAMSIHLRFNFDETAFRATFRVGGMPAWGESLKPRKGASTKRESPFVTLAARA